jgi:regulator of sirC expression with transglutaminase-like and TPR domain
MGDAQLAVADLEIYIDQTDDASDRDSMQARVSELRRALS